MPELAMRGTPDVTAEQRRHELHAVTDAQHRDAEPEHLGVAHRRPRVGHAARSAREDEAGRLAGPQGLDGRAVGHDLGVHRQLAETPRNQLRVLRAEIEDEDGLVQLMPVGKPVLYRGVAVTGPYILRRPGGGDRGRRRRPGGP
jgi:hypothetical protein